MQRISDPSQHESLQCPSIRNAISTFMGPDAFVGQNVLGRAQNVTPAKFYVLDLDDEVPRHNLKCITENS